MSSTAPRTLDALLRSRASPGDRVAVLYADSAQQPQSQSFAELLQDALQLLGGLQAQGLQHGDRVIFQLDRAADFLPALWACFLGGIVVAPLATVAVFSGDNANARKLRAVWELLQRPVILSDADMAQRLRAADAAWADVRVLVPEALRQAKAAPVSPSIKPEDVALLLFTSGSTGQPKGVVLEHRNLLAMAAGTAQMNRFDEREVTLNWMPLDHAGAIAFLGVLPMWLGATQVHVPTGLIVAQPMRWLELMSRHRASISWAPNFAFGLINECVAQLPAGTFDLSCMRFLVNAGEQVTAQAARGFLAVLAAQGLAPTALRPAFGMSETCSGITWSPGLTLEALQEDPVHVSLGGPIPGASLRITGPDGKVLAPGEIGQLELRGASVTRGYHANEALNRQMFTGDGWFRSGDLGFILDGALHITGREKEELIFNGRNVPAHEIETLVESIEGVATSFTCAFAVREPGKPSESLVIVFSPEPPASDAWPPLITRIQRSVASNVGVAPAYVLPLARDAVPKTGIGKIQRSRLQRAFEDGAYAQLATRFGPSAHVPPGQTPASAIEQQIAGIWQAVLGLPAVGRDENFFDLGGHSLLLIRAHARLEALFGAVPLSVLFAHPSVAAQARLFADRQGGESVQRPGPRSARRRRPAADTDVAVIGMACRLPGADTTGAFWDTLIRGEECIRHFSDAEMAASHVDPRSAGHADYVKASPVLQDAAGFDAAFFGFSDKEAEVMDPQHRLFLECCWESFEDAGYDPLTCPGSVGVYAGASMNTYLLNNVLPHRAQFDPQDDLRTFTLDSMGGFQLMVANDKDYLNTRVSYKLNLRGPSLNVQTACSSGLVVIHQAVQSLLAGECDMALAGTASVQCPEAAGHLYREGMIVSPDGHCRAFDAQARGTIFGSGVGAVLLKRLDQALHDGDRILAVVKGSAVNNDGQRKVGYLAPSEDGESEVTRQALDVAGVDAATIGLLEAHGTGTPIGDPIEVASLTRAFRADTDKTGFCALGSVKTNVGHLQISSGTVGFMKAVLALHHRRIPATLHFERANPAIDFERTPFFVNTTALDWPEGGTPRRAGVNSLGIGGTNAHVVLEEAPESVRTVPAARRPCHVLALSARAGAPLAALRGRYRDRLLADPLLPLEDLCYTANTGRHHFDHRFAAVFSTREELLAQLTAPAETATAAPVAPSGVAFMFTGQGSQHAGMARELYGHEPIFRAAMDRCAELLVGQIDQPLLELLHPGEGEASPIDDTAQAQPALFAVEYALARLWLSWGVAPAALIGHSVGEYVAACLAGVFTLEEGLALIVARARLMQALPRDGRMLAVMADAEQVAAALAAVADRVSVAAINGERHTVISGASDAVAVLEQSFAAQEVQTVALRTSHAFHSPLMRPMLADFRRVVRGVALRPPRWPLVSNVTGQVETQLFTDPDYWVRHVEAPVNFLAGLQALEQLHCGSVVEIGPKPVLCGLWRAARPQSPPALASLRMGASDSRQMLDSVAELYRRGHSLEWGALYDAAARRRLALPLYPFVHRRHWLAPDPGCAAEHPATAQALHPLVHRRVAMPGLPQQVFETVLSPLQMPLLMQHRVFDRVVVAGAGHLAMLLAGASLLTGRDAGFALSGLAFAEALVLGEQASRHVQLQFTPQPPGHAVRLVGFDPAQAAHSVHASATLGVADAPPPPLDWPALRSRCRQEVTADQFYRQLAARHIVLGPAFSWLHALWLGPGEALFDIQPPEGVEVNPAYQLHPGLIDSLLQPALLVLAAGQHPGTQVPVALESFCFFRRPAALPLRGHARRRVPRAGGTQECADIRVFDAHGHCVAEVRGFEFRQVDAARFVPGGHGLSETLYALRWRELLPSDGAAGLPSPEQVLADPQVVTQGLEALIEEVNSPRHRQQSDDLERLGLAYIVESLRAAQAMPLPGAALSLQEMARRLQVVPAFMPALGRLLHLLELDGRLLCLDPQRWQGVACPELPPADAQVARIQSRHAERADAELTLLRRCGERLGDILRGLADPLEALFPGGDLSAATRLYQDSAGFRALNTVVANIVQHLACTMPAPRLRVLEIGAGTGATSHHVLPRLDAGRTDYVFTDISTLFVQRARARFAAAHPFTDFRLLDIERDPGPQGFKADHDIVIAANVLHATRSIAQTLAHVRGLLRPGGYLVLLEVNQATVPVDLTFGLLEGWWRFSDHDLRPDYPLLNQAQWLDQLRAHGFAGAAAARVSLPTPGGLQTVFVAQADARPVVPAGAGAWGLVGGAGGLAAALAGALAARGQPCLQLPPGGAAALATALEAAGPLRGVISLAALDAADGVPADPPVQVMGRVMGGALDLVHALAATQRSVPLHLVTRGAQQADGDDPLQASLWGLGRVLFQEQPELAGRLIDLDPAADTAEAASALAVALCGADPEERELVLRGRRQFVSRLLPTQPTPRAAALRADGLYLVTGGLGGLGLRLAQELVARGARRLLLLGRSTPGAPARAMLAALAAQGAQVQVVQADVTDEAALRRVFDAIPSDTPLTGVFHLAGELREGVLALAHEHDLVQRASAKAVGALLLDRLTRGRAGLMHFVLFSSAAAWMGVPGQGAYAAANACLDALAQQRQARGEPALSINWGPWSELGMVAGAAAQLAQQGHDAMAPAEGMSLLFDLLGCGAPQIAVLPVRWPCLLDGMRRPPRLFAEVAGPGAVSAAAPQVAGPAPADAAPPPDADADAIERYLAAQLRQMLGGSGALDRQLGFTALGLDSLMSIDLRHRIVRDLGVNLPLGALLDTSLQHLAEQLHAQRRLLAGLRLREVPDPGVDAASLEEDFLL